MFLPSSVLSSDQLLDKSRNRDKYREIIETSQRDIPAAAGKQNKLWRDQTRSNRAVITQDAQSFHSTSDRLEQARTDFI